MAMMKSFVILSVLTGLSVQLPHPGKPKSLDRRTYGTSQYSTTISRSNNVVDNQRLKYLLPVTVAGSTFDLEFDTGSSDTWIIQTGFDCFDNYVSGQGLDGFTGPEPESVCNFGQTYSPGSEFSQVDGIVDISCYGSNENSQRCVAGPFGYAPISFAGLNIPSQLIGAPNLSSYPAQGDAAQSGILGLGYPTLTSAAETGDGNFTNVPYSPIVNTMFNVDTFVPPLNAEFSIALSRDSSGNGNGGALTFGGLPDLADPTINASASFTTAPLQYVSSISSTAFSFYSIYIDNIVVGSSTVEAGAQIIVDSGANVFEASNDTVNLINSYWSPPIADDGSIECDAVLTQPVGVTVGGVTYYIESVDLIGYGLAGDSCYPLVSTTTEDFYSISDPLLRNTVVLYDLEDSVLAFFPRPLYES